MEATRQNIMFLLNEIDDMEQILSESASLGNLSLGVVRDPREKDKTNFLTESQSLSDINLNKNKAVRRGGRKRKGK